MTMIPADPQPPELASTGSVITPAALDRLRGEAAGQERSAASQLALTPYEWGAMPINPTTNPTAQDAHPSAQRLATGQLSGKTSQLNHAQAAAPGAEVWVTVPVDKVTTTRDGSGVVPVYASTKGYTPRPGESRGSVPPGHRVGRPY